MQVIFPPEILREESEDRLFLESLDKRLHYVQRSLAETNLTGSVHEIAVDLYHYDQKLYKNELEEVLSLIGKETQLAITPISTNYGFSVGFAILYTDIYGSKIYFLKFIEQQLPDGYNFNRLSEVFNREENIEMLVSCGLEKPKERWHYEY